MSFAVESQLIFACELSLFTPSLIYDMLLAPCTVTFCTEMPYAIYETGEDNSFIYWDFHSHCEHINISLPLMGSGHSFFSPFPFKLENGVYYAAAYVD